MAPLYAVVAILYAFIAIVGICIGSFLNVLIYRIPNHIDFTKGRSFCPGCGHSLKAADLVPVFSYLFLKGRCRYCGDKISFRYPLIELLGGLMAVLSVATAGLTWHGAMVFVVSCLLIVIAFIDIDTMEISNVLVLIILGLGIADFFVCGRLTWLEALIGFGCVSIPMTAISFLIPGAFGGGDIKLCAACGVLLGWKCMLAAVFIAIITGGIYGIILLVSKKKGAKEHFAFGPFLALGITAALFFGNQLIDFYLSLFGLM